MICGVKNKHIPVSVSDPPADLASATFKRPFLSTINYYRLELFSNSEEIFVYAQKANTLDLYTMTPFTAPLLLMMH